VNCPSCKKPVKDGASICPHCDAVLDESILGSVPEDTVDDTPVPEAKPKKKPAAKPGAKPATGKKPAARRPAPVAEPDPEAEEEKKKDEAPSFADGKYKNKYSQYWTEEDGAKGAAVEKAEAPLAPTSLSPDMAEGDQPVDPLEMLKGTWAAFLALHFEDKLTVAASMGAVISAFMPWKSTTTDGDEMGLLGSGFFTTCLAITAIVSVWARKSNKVPSVPRGKFPLAAVGAGALSALFCIIAGISAYQRGVVAGKAATISEPSFGVFLALIAAAGMIVGGILTLKREK